MNPAAAFGRRMLVATVVASVVANGGWGSVAEAAPMYCPAGALTLSGGTSATETIGVDDDLELRLNGVTITATLTSSQRNCRRSPSPPITATSCG